MRLALAAIAAFLILTAPLAAAPNPEITLVGQSVGGFPSYPGNDWVRYDADIQGGIGNLDLLIHHRCYDSNNVEVYGGASTGTSYGIGDERMYLVKDRGDLHGDVAFAVLAPWTTPFPTYCVGWVYAEDGPGTGPIMSNVVVTVVP